MRFDYDFGINGRFDLDVRYSTWGLDEQALLELKEKPGRILNGRVYKMALREACGRTIDARRDRRLAELAATDVVLDYDEEPDVIGERLVQKALRRKHRDSEHYRKVRQDYAGGWGHFDLRCAKKELRRSSRRKLNAKAVFADKDAIGKHGSLFSDVEPWSVRGWRNLGGKVEVDG